MLSEHIQDHKSWITGYDLTNIQAENLNKFYQDWANNGFMPNLSTYIDTVRIMEQYR